MVVEEAIGDATLHDETLVELGLSEQPYIDNKKFNRFADSTTQNVRAAMEQHLRFGESINLFVGEKGVGKTVFLSQLIKHCKDSIQPFVAKGTDNFETVAFLAAVLNQLGGEETESISDHVDALIPLFDELADQQKSVVLAIDDAHIAPLEEIAELIDIMPSFVQENGDISARLLLTGEPRLKDELTAIADELEGDGFSFEHATTTLHPLDESRVGDYLASQLNQAGFTDAFPFTDKAVSKIHRESQGLPANVNSMAAKYLNTVYSGKAAAAGGKGFIAALGWPLLALGAAAMGLIAWGLSMFFGSNTAPEAVVTIDSPTVVESVASTDLAVPANVTESTAVLTADNSQLATPDTQDTSETIVASAEIVKEPVVINTPAIDTTPVTTQSVDLLKPEDQPETTVAAAVENTIPMATTLPMPENITDNAVVETVVGIAEPATETIDQNTQDLVTNLPATEQIVNAAETLVSEPVSVPNSIEVAVPAIENSTNTAEATTLVTEPDTNASRTDDLNDTTGGIAVAVDPLNPAGINAAVQTTDQPDIRPSADDNGVSVPVAAPVENRAIENERWVLFQTPTKFTVQLATSRERNYIIDLAQTMEAEDPVAIYPFLTTNSNNPVFGLLSGLYDTRSEAIAAVERMPSATKQFGVWIRPIADLQADIKKQR